MNRSAQPPFVHKGSVWRRLLLGKAFRLLSPFRRAFECPLCGYYGPFKRKVTRRYNHVRNHAKCPVCRSNERERLQFLVARQVLGNRTGLAVLHVAPERILGQWLNSISQTYVTADLLRQDVAVQCDIESMPFDDASFDLVFASHVLVYARDDARAIAEVRRVLRPGGIAIMPVPILAEKTTDPEGKRFFHEPGVDYPDRFRAGFARVETWVSSEFDERFQLYFYERPLKSVAGQPEPHPESLRVAQNQWQDMVPVCFAD
jgi:SAM-dependent methyltransferase